jgi:hypothetical protein
MMKYTLHRTRNCSWSFRIFQITMVATGQPMAKLVDE